MDEGIFIDHRQVVFYVGKGENNVFLRESELKGLEKKIAELEAKKHALDARMQSSQQKRIRLQEEKAELDQSIRRSEMKFVEVNFSLQRSRADLEKGQQEVLQIEQETQGLQRAIEDLMELLAQLGRHHTDARTKAAKEQELNTVLAEDLELRVLALKNEQQALQEKEALYRKHAEENGKLADSLHVLEVKNLDNQEQERRLREEVELSRNRSSNSKARNPILNQAWRKLKKSLKEP